MVSRETLLPREQAKWYVYRLIDARNGQTFYVGKGTGDRLTKHEYEVRLKIEARKAAGTLESFLRFSRLGNRRERKIVEILTSGSSVLAEPVAYFWDELEAALYERALIDEGGDSLTNDPTRRNSAVTRAINDIVGQNDDWVEGETDALLRLLNSDSPDARDLIRAALLHATEIGATSVRR